MAKGRSEEGAYKVDLNVLDRARPSVEPEDLIRKIDTFVSREIMYALSRSTRP